jgi:hypothetical protein
MSVIAIRVNASGISAATASIRHGKRRILREGDAGAANDGNAADSFRISAAWIAMTRR